MNQQERIDEDKQHVVDDFNWPHWPLLPVKKVGGRLMDEKAAGFIVAARGIPRTRVYLANIWGLEAGMLGDILRKLEHKEYQSVDEMLVDWMVD